MAQSKTLTQSPPKGLTWRTSAWWQIVWLIASRELRDQIRDWRILTPIFGLTLVFPLLANFTAGQMVNFMNRYGAAILTERLFPFLMLTVGFFPLSISLVVALESFAGERERGTIEPLLAAPLSDGQLYLGKLLAVLALPFTASWLGLGAYLLTLGLRVGWWPDWALLGSVVLLNTVQAIVMVSGAVVVSAQATSVRSANLLASVIILPVALLLMFESMLMFWQRYAGLIWLAAALIVVAVMLVRMGLAHFNREALLGREWDRLQWRTIWGHFWAGWRGETTTWRAWLRETWRFAWREQAQANLVAALFLLLAVILGASLVFATPLPQSPAMWSAYLSAPQGLSAEPFTRSPLAHLYGWRAALFIFIHNLRTLAIIVLAGGLSLGLGGVLLTALPLGLLGFLMEMEARLGVIGRLGFWLALVLPHGIAEIPAMILLSGALMRWGARLVTPNPTEGLGQGWLHGLGEVLRVVFVVVLPLFALAALLEAFVSPLVAWYALR